ncbi:MULTISPECIES: pantoate--beta-alanine ligase [unclassified Virgibacillus]|uniref:pantoate--beta-alanine ligase n=1 Tax=unclassified Virgibacillus TaxID=2620237 RepID=UPI0024DEC06E|nr:pantoate--beta-alanine ligase [Virgibacillus sp. LDC-1]
MEIIRTVDKMRLKINALQAAKNTIGFVPTMGYFHEGHLRLMEEAKKENTITIASIFVNPLQFGPNEDFDNYPRNEKRDIQLAEKVNVDFLFIPTVNEMYPQNMKINVSILDRTDVLCGRSRPGHFNGVITVLTKLFHIIQPDNVYFGLKDAQQVAVVDALIQDLNFPIHLHGVPTVREQDGLAKSSRNVNLTLAERKNAPILAKALQDGRRLVVDGETDTDIIINEVTKSLHACIGKIDYIELLSFPELRPVETINQHVILAVAVQYNHARLIDNIIFDQNGTIIDYYHKEK